PPRSTRPSRTGTWCWRPAWKPERAARWSGLTFSSQKVRESITKEDLSVTQRILYPDTQGDANDTCSARPAAGTAPPRCEGRFPRRELRRAAQPPGLRATGADRRPAPDRDRVLRARAQRAFRPAMAAEPGGCRL